MSESVPGGRPRPWLLLECPGRPRAAGGRGVDRRGPRTPVSPISVGGGGSLLHTACWRVPPPPPLVAATLKRVVPLLTFVEEPTA